MSNKVFLEVQKAQTQKAKWETLGRSVGFKPIGQAKLNGSPVITESEWKRQDQTELV